jgi:mannose/fructose-specific phosphotransferase system component IIA
VICGIVATHGKLGDELIQTAEQIAGPQQGLLFVSNEGLSADALAGTVTETVRQCPGVTGVLIMTDVPGGSCTLVCRSIKEFVVRAWIVTGVNLPMVLAFLHYRDSVEPERLAEVVAQRGVKAIEVVC